MDPREIAPKVEAFLQLHPNASLTNTADRLGLSPQDIEHVLGEVHGTSFQEFRQNVKLNEAFRQLGETRIMPEGSWEEMRYHPRRIIPRTTVRIGIRRFWRRPRSFSKPLPLVDLSRGGFALLSDSPVATDKRVSVMLKFPGKSEELQLEGRTIYAVATGIAGFRYRIGVQFMPFADRMGCNPPKALALLEIGMTAKER
jgi:AraC-like DNA-binding protein